jgi:hypothetical protein
VTGKGAKQKADKFMKRVKNLLAVSFALFAAIAPVLGQASIQDLGRSHAAALGDYLAKNSKNSFRAETIVDAAYLKYMRESLGKTFRPNYVAADLNGDRIGDFAVLLNRQGSTTNQPSGENASKEHFPDYPLTLVVFNGMRGGKFRVAFSRDFDGPRAAFIHLTPGRRLYYGVFETDSDIFTLVAAGKGYVVK